MGAKHVKTVHCHVDPFCVNIYGSDSPGNVATKVLFCKTCREVCFKQAWTCSKLMLGNWDFSLLFSCTRPTFVSTTVNFLC